MAFPVWFHGDRFVTAWLPAAGGLLLALAAGVWWPWSRRRADRRVLGLLTRYANDMVLLLDDRGRILDANERAVEYAGYGLDELRRMTVLDLTDPSCLELGEQVMRRAASEGRALFEMLGRRRDGSTYPIEVSLRRIESGGRVYYHNIARDITERRKTNEALAWESRLNQSLARLTSEILARDSFEEVSRLVLTEAQEFTASPAGYVGHLDPETGILIRTHYSPAVEGACGIPDTRVKVLDSRGLPGWVLQNRQPLLANQPRQDPRSQGLPAGHVPIDRFLSVPALAGDALVGQIAVANAPRDYTPRDQNCLERLAAVYALAIRRQQQQAALEDSERRLRGILENMPVLMSAFAPDGRLLIWNAECQRVTGYASEEIPSLEHLFTIIFPDPEERRAHLERTREVPDRGEQEHRVMAKDGAIRYVTWFDLTRMLPVAGWGRWGVGLDITERHETQDRLRVTLAAAQEATVAKSRFLANMSHEIRTPIHGVLGMTELLLSTSLTAEQREFADTVNASAENLLAIINDILDLSKIEAGKLALEDRPFDPGRLVEEVAALLAAPAHHKGLELSTWIAPSIPRLVRGDAGRLRQVLTNLVGNAVKFTERGEVCVRVDADPAGLRFSVSDTGVGIAPEDRSRLFETFVQLDSSQSRRYGGTGLGLALARRLVEFMGGAIDFDSLPGRGSRFWFTLPAPIEEPAAAPSPLLSGARILLVGGTEAARTGVLEYLREWGCQADARSSGRGGCDACDAVLVDVPAGGAAPRLEEFRGRPVIALLPVTAAAGNEAAALFKPVRRAQLWDRLAAALGKASSEPPALASGLPACPAGLRVLVAEDHPVNQKVLLRLLDRDGCLTRAVPNGRAAVEEFARSAYDLILMDVQMPDMDGLEATREIRRRERPGSHVPIVALTASAMAGDREKCEAAGMDDYISKPVRSEDLRSALRRWQFRGESHDEASLTPPTMKMLPMEGGL